MNKKTMIFYISFTVMIASVTSIAHRFHNLVYPLNSSLLRYEATKEQVEVYNKMTARRDAVARLYKEKCWRLDDYNQHRECKKEFLSWYNDLYCEWEWETEMCFGWNSMWWYSGF